jgi:hypothetical protein
MRPDEKPLVSVSILQVEALYYIRLIQQSGWLSREFCKISCFAEAGAEIEVSKQLYCVLG